MFLKLTSHNYRFTQGLGFPNKVLEAVTFLVIILKRYRSATKVGGRGAKLPLAVILSP